MKSNLAKLRYLALAAAVVATSAFATGDAVDVTATVTTIGDQIASITAIGTAVLAVIVSIKAFKWVRRAM